MYQRPRKESVKHDDAVEDILWCLSMGMTRRQITRKLGYARTGVDQVISRERKYAERDGRKSRL